MSVQKLRRSWSASRNQSHSQHPSQAWREQPDPGAVHSGPGVMREFSETSQFKPNDENYDIGEFRTTDYSMINKARHNWTREDTFQTPAGHAGRKAKRVQSSVIDVEDSHMSTCQFQKEWLIAMKNKIVEGVNAEIQAETALLRQDISRVQDVLRSDLHAEMMILRGDLAKSVQGHREGPTSTQEVSSNEILEEIRKLSDSRYAPQIHSNVSVDFTPMINAMQSLQVTVLEQMGTDCAAVLQQVSTKRPQDDLRPVLTQLQAVQTTILEQLGTDLQHVLQQVSTKRPQDDLHPVLTQLQTIQQTQTSLTETIQAEIRKINIDASKLNFDFTPVLEEIQKIQVPAPAPAPPSPSPSPPTPAPVNADLSPVLGKIEALQVALLQQLKPPSDAAVVDLKPVMEALSAIDLKVDFERHLQNASEKVEKIEKIEKISSSGVDFTPVLEDIRKVLEEIKQINSGNTPEIKMDASKINVDLAPILEEIRKINIDASKVDVDFTQVLEEIRKINTGNIPEIDASKINVDLTPILEEIRKINIDSSKVDVDFTQVLEEIRKINTGNIPEIDASKVNVDLTPILEEIRKINIDSSKVDIDFTQVLEEIRKISTGNTPEIDASKVNVDLTPILEEIRKINIDASKVDVDFTQVLEEIRKISTGNTPEIDASKINVDLTPILEEIRKINIDSSKVDVDFTQVLEEIRKISRVDLEPPTNPVVNPVVDFGPVLEAISQLDLREAISKIDRVDLTEVLNEIQLIKKGLDHGPAADLKPVLEAISQIDLRVDLTEVLSEIQLVKKGVDEINLLIDFKNSTADLKQVLEAISQIDLRVDLTEVLSEIQLIKKGLDHGPAVDLKPVLEAISQIDCRVDLTEVLSEIQLVKKGVDGISLDVDIEKVINAMQISIGDKASHSSTVDLKPVVEAISQIDLRVDLTEVLSEIQLIKKGLDHGPAADLKPVLEAISQIDLRVDLTEVLSEIQLIKKTKVDVDFDPVINHMNAMQINIVNQVIQGSAVDLKPVIEAISQIDLGIDLNPVINHMNAMQISIVKEVVQGSAVDLKPVLEAISQIDLRVDLTEVLNEIQLIKKTKVDVDFEPVINHITSMQTSIVNQVIQGSAVDLNPVLEAISQIDLGIDFEPVINHMNAKQISIIKEIVQGSAVDLKPVIEAISKIDLRVDLTEVFTDLQLIKKGLGSINLDVDFEPVITHLNAMQISIVNQVVQGSAVDLKPVIEAISQIDLGIDLDPVINTLNVMQVSIVNQVVQGSVIALQPVLEPLRADLTLIKQVVQDVDLTLVVKDITTQMNAMQTSIVNQIVQGAAVDLKPVLAAISQIDFRVDLTQVVNEIHLVKNVVDSLRSEDVRHILQKIEAFPTRIDYAPVLNQLTTMHNYIATKIGSIDYGPVIEAINKIDVDINMDEIITVIRNTDFGPVLQRIEMLEQKLQLGFSQDLAVMFEANFEAKLGVIMKLDGFINYVYAKLEDIDGNNEQFLVRLGRLNEELLPPESAFFGNMRSVVYEKVHHAVSSAEVSHSMVSAIQDVFGKDIAFKLNNMDMHLKSVEKEMMKITNNSIAGRDLDAIEGKMGLKTPTGISSRISTNFSAVMTDEVVERLQSASFVDDQAFNAKKFLKEVLWCCRELPPEVLMHQFDANQDAELEPAEFRKLLEQYGNAVSLTDAQVMEVFNLIDTNRDGAISFRELEASLGVVKGMSSDESPMSVKRMSSKSSEMSVKRMSSTSSQHVTQTSAKKTSSFETLPKASGPPASLGHTL